MSVKESLLIGATVLGLAVGAHQMLAPRTPAELDRQVREQRVQDLADVDERRKERLREELPENLDAERERSRTPGEHRPPELPRLRVRLP